MWAWTPHLESFPVPALTELSLPANAWPWTIDVWTIRALIFVMLQWATKYRVNLNYWICFPCSNSYVKATKNKLWTRLRLVLLNTNSTILHIKVIFEKCSQEFFTENNRCLTNKRCFWGWSIFSIQNRYIVSGFASPYRQLILYAFLGFLSINYY